MGSESAVETRFRERIKDERKSRDWSQADLSQHLQRKGFEHIYPTTVAKIESGERTVRIDEAAALADLFEVSLDTLLGRSVAPKNDRRYAAKVLLQQAGQASAQVSSIEVTLRDRVAELAAWEPKGWMKSFQSRCERACDQLAKANAALQEALDMPGDAAANRFFRRTYLAQLQAEENADDAQS